MNHAIFREVAVFSLKDHSWEFSAAYYHDFCVSGPVCKYLITSSEKDVPFDVQVIDQYTGAAVIRVKVSLLFEISRNSRNFFKLPLESSSCSSHPPAPHCFICCDSNPESYPLNQVPHDNEISGYFCSFSLIQSRTSCIVT